MHELRTSGKHGGEAVGIGLAVAVFLILASGLCGVVRADTAVLVDGAAPAAAAAAGDAPEEGGTSFQAGGATERPPGVESKDFRAYVFWAYGFVCLLLLAFTAYAVVQSRTIAERVRVLTARFEESSPESPSGS